LRDLRVWLVGSEELAIALGQLCEIALLAPDKWRQLAERPPALVLVEPASGIDEAWGAEFDRLVATCEAQGIPCLFWSTTDTLDSYWLERCSQFERMFTVDRGQLADLEAAGATDPGILWPATAPSSTWRFEKETVERSYDVVWLGGWRNGWPRDWRERLASVLRGATVRGLRIVAAANLEKLPADLRGCVADATNGDPMAVLRRAKVVLGADPFCGSPSLAPRIVFDAAAAGAAVITPHDFASLHDFAVGGTPDASWRNLVPVVHDREVAAKEIDCLLDDDLLRLEIVDHLRRIVANNHTYAHRLATLASAAGYRLVPDANDPAPA
jgi:hypothetical protein